MAPKKSAKSAPTAADKDGAQEEPLAAVILADSFSRVFTPLDTPPQGASRSELLRPLLNVPLLAFHLRALALAKVSRVHILSVGEADGLRDYLALNAVPGSLDVGIIRVPEARSVGDCMRELDAHQVIRGDFLLLQPDAIVGMDLAHVVERHRQRKLKDKDLAMTVCAMQVGIDARTRPAHSALHILTRSSQLLHYVAPGTTHASSIPSEILFLEEKEGGDGELDVRADLVEVGVDVCGAEVPPLFSENFDYQSLRRDFVPGILTSDLLDSKIFVHVAASAPHRQAASTSAYGYGARADTTRMYDAVSHDLLVRAAWPLAPGNNAWAGEKLERRGCAYVGAGVKLARTAVLGPSSLLGSGCTLDSDARITRSVLGSHVSVGAASVISGAHVWQDTRIGSNCLLERCIVAQDVRILDGVTVSRGCLIGPGCTVGPNVTLAPFSRVAARPRSALDADDDDDDWAGDASTPTADSSLTAQRNQNELGAQSVGYVWPSAGEAGDVDDSDDEDEEAIDAPLRDHLGYVAAEPSSDLDSCSSIGGDSELMGSWDGASDSGASSAPSAVGASLTLDGAADETAADLAAAEKRLADFRGEAAASLERAFKDKHSIDDAAIELKTLRMASNVPLSEVRRTTIALVFDRCAAIAQGSPVAMKHINEVLNKWGPLLTIISEDDPAECLEMVQSYCATHEGFTGLFVLILQKLWEDDVVEDENIFGWFKSAESHNDSAKAALREKARPLVLELVKRAQDSSEEEDSDSD